MTSLLMLCLSARRRLNTERASDNCGAMFCRIQPEGNNVSFFCCDVVNENSTNSCKLTSVALLTVRVIRESLNCRFETGHAQCGLFRVPKVSSSVLLLHERQSGVSQPVRGYKKKSFLHGFFVFQGRCTLLLVSAPFHNVTRLAFVSHKSKRSSTTVHTITRSYTKYSANVKKVQHHVFFLLMFLLETRNKEERVLVIHKGFLRASGVAIWSVCNFSV